MVIAVKVLNTKTMEEYNYSSIINAKHAIIPLSARSGYTFKVYNTNTGELIGNIRPNPADIRQPKQQPALSGRTKPIPKPLSNLLTTDEKTNNCSVGFFDTIRF